jgi:Grap2 and cyclin-D-interacting
MQETVKRISGFVDSIPPTLGRTYLEHIQKLARSAFTAAITLCKSLAEAKEVSKIDQILKSTGSVWDVCKSFESEVASNNREAVEKQWKSVSEMVADAQEELQDFIAEQNEDDNKEDEEDDGWGDIMENGTKMTPVQLEACKKTFSMIKMTSMLLKKVQLRSIATASNDAETNVWLDDLSRASTTVSDQIDIVASSFYEEDANLKDYIASFVASALSLITIVETRVKEDEQVRWFQVSKAQILYRGV